MEAHVHGRFRRRGAASGLGGYPGEIIQLSVPNPSAVLVDPLMSSCRGNSLFGFSIAETIAAVFPMVCHF